MKDPIQRYLDKRADLTSRPLDSHTTDGITAIVVIPALAEATNLDATLDSLAENPVEHLSHTLIIIVVNNRSPEITSADHIEDNQCTLQQLRQRMSDSTSPLRLAIIDASTPGNELAAKEGVGSARKIGLDHALAILHQNNAQPGTLICLDADTLVEPNYLQTIAVHFAQPHAWAAVIDYAHRLEGTPEQQRAITDYEAFLRYHEAGLRYAASPYAFHTIGSTMVCTAHAYTAVSGMNKKQAGEDFYFLQELAKTGHVHPIHGTTVHPSSRTSWRVPFGTGKRMGQLMNDPNTPFPAYHPQSYQILKQWLQVVTQIVTKSLENDNDVASIPPSRGDQGGCSPTTEAAPDNVVPSTPDPGAPSTPYAVPGASDPTTTPNRGMGILPMKKTNHRRNAYVQNQVVTESPGSATTPTGTGSNTTSAPPPTVSLRTKQSEVRQSNHPDHPAPTSDTPDTLTTPLKTNSPLQGGSRGVSTANIPYGSTLLTQAHAIHPQLAAYLIQEQFEKNWTRLRQHAPNHASLHQQFHRWFDALKTLRLIHHLRDTAYPDQDLHQAIQDLKDFSEQEQTDSSKK